MHMRTEWLTSYVCNVCREAESAFVGCWARGTARSINRAPRDLGGDVNQFLIQPHMTTRTAGRPKIVCGYWGVIVAQ